MENYKELVDWCKRESARFAVLGNCSEAEKFTKMGRAITELLDRAEKAERERDAAIHYMRKKFGWCTGCTHFTGIYGSGCKIGEIATCGEGNEKYLFCEGG